MRLFCSLGLITVAAVVAMLQVSAPRSQENSDYRFGFGIVVHAEVCEAEYQQCRDSFGITKTVQPRDGGGGGGVRDGCHYFSHKVCSGGGCDGEEKAQHAMFVYKCYYRGVPSGSDVRDAGCCDPWSR